jgi:hypothetical protein
VLRVPYNDFLGYILISLVVAGASYLHVVQRMIAGFVIVLIAGGMVGFVGIVGAAILAVSAVDDWTVVLIYVPGWTAFITVIASIVTQLRRRGTRRQEKT